MNGPRVQQVWVTLDVQLPLIGEQPAETVIEPLTAEVRAAANRVRQRLNDGQPAVPLLPEITVTATDCAPDVPECPLCQGWTEQPGCTCIPREDR